jgi:hypothetical protein
MRNQPDRVYNFTWQVGHSFCKRLASLLWEVARQIGISISCNFSLETGLFAMKSWLGRVAMTSRHLLIQHRPNFRDNSALGKSARAGQVSQDRIVMKIDPGRVFMVSRPQGTRPGLSRPSLYGNSQADRLVIGTRPRPSSQGPTCYGDSARAEFPGNSASGNSARPSSHDKSAYKFPYRLDQRAQRDLAIKYLVSRVFM